MLAGREPVTVRALAQSAGTSTMAVYTHFGGLPGLWRAVRQEGFIRLSHRLQQVQTSADPVRDLAALGAAYLANAVANQYLYRAMFDAAADLEDPHVADAGFRLLVAAAERARAAGRFSADTDPHAVALQFWSAGHGLLMLVLSGVLPAQTLDQHPPALAQALFVAAGDDPDRCRDSIRAGYRSGARSGRRGLGRRPAQPRKA